MSDRPFRFTSDGELFDALNAYVLPISPRRRGGNAPLAVCIAALLIAGVGAVRSVEDPVAAVPARATATEAPATR